MTQRHENRVWRFLLLPLALWGHCARSCTNFLITKGASADGHNTVTYAADSHTLYGALYHFPAGRHSPSTMRKVVDWDSGVYLGEIPEAEETYNVVGNVNEHGLAITETTFGGLSQLAGQEGAIIDYGSLIYIALQRSRSAREAIKVMTELVAEYGYASEGESFSLADKDEVWILELIGKGSGERGAVWVAVRVPDGYVSSHANQARIRTFPRDSPDVLYAPDVVEFARSKGLYGADAAEEDFSFSDVYNPVNFETARGCEARVWDFFHRVGADVGGYLDYVSGQNLSHRMPLWVKPGQALETAQIMAAMRSHYEDTPLDFRTDVGAQGFGLPYRWRPLTWKSSEGKEYFHERSAGTQQTGFTLVAQIRASMPAPLRALLHFGVDDTASTVYAPFYGGMTAVPPSYATGDIMEFSFHSAFWVFNLVANWAYSRYDLIHPEVEKRILHLEGGYRQLVQDLDAEALDLWSKGKMHEAIQTVTQACVANAEGLVKEWLSFFQYLFVKYMDGNVKTRSTDPARPTPHVEQPGYPQAWVDTVAKETRDRYAVPEAGKGALQGVEARPFKAKGL